MANTMINKQLFYKYYFKRTQLQITHTKIYINLFENGGDLKVYVLNNVSHV